MSAPPFAPGGVSLRVYPSDDDAVSIVEEMREQARLAEASGFDGLMTSEHHGGFPGYIPNPLQQAGWLLEATRRIWAAPAPLLLPLQHWSHVAEALAWLAGRFPGRVGGGVAIGGLRADFELAEIPWEEKLARFEAALPRLAQALRGDAEAPLASDPAIAACAASPIPLLSAAQSPGAVRRAAACGAGLLFDSLQTPERIGNLVAAYRAAEGRGPCIGIRKVWLGTPPSEHAEAQLRFYQSYTTEQSQRHWGKDTLVTGRDGKELAERLLDFTNRSACQALNLRVHLTGLPAGRLREQIEIVGHEVLPVLQQGLAAQQGIAATSEATR
ncbi:MAG: LLM class flavin-dependent oxidoreductase [Myxococcales bacterium]|nr:LLM class flavin-dependent oxidoreductase [Myxococcales bacterium]